MKTNVGFGHDNGTMFQQYSLDKLISPQQSYLTKTFNKMIARRWLMITFRVIAQLEQIEQFSTIDRPSSYNLSIYISKLNIDRVEIITQILTEKVWNIERWTDIHR